MAYIVTANTGGKINLAPKTREEEILQNVRFLLSTPKFTVPLDRDFGLAQRFITWPSRWGTEKCSPPPEGAARCA